MGFHSGSDGKKIHLRCRRHVFDLWVGKTSWRREWLPNSSILAWRIPWTKERGGPQSMGLQRVRLDWVTNIITFNQYILTWVQFHNMIFNITHTECKAPNLGMGHSNIWAKTGLKLWASCSKIRGIQVFSIHSHFFSQPHLNNYQIKFCIYIN